MHPLSPVMSTNLILHFHAVPSAGWFRNTLSAIKRVYRFITMESVTAYYYGNKKFNNCCHITFDDGDRTSYDHAFPVLKEMGIPATLFVSPKIISSGRNYWFQDLSCIRNKVSDISLKKTVAEVLNCDYAQIEKYMIFSIFKSMKIRDIFRVIEAVKKEHNVAINEAYNITVRELHELGDSKNITIGAHTMNHPVLNNESDTDAEKEIRESIEGLSQILKQEVSYFAYPNGVAGLDCGAREEAMLRENKIKLSFTTNSHFFGHGTNPFSFPRHGLGGLAKENNTRILGRFFFLPFWDAIRNVIRPEPFDVKEIRERKEIKGSAIL